MPVIVKIPSPENNWLELSYIPGAIETLSINRAPMMSSAFMPAEGFHSDYRADFGEAGQHSTLSNPRGRLCLKMIEGFP